MSSSAGPLFFHHIPKTGGTSVSTLLRACTAPDRTFTEPGNTLSLSYTLELAAAAPPPSALIHGHPGWDACRPFRGKARFVTLLREPRRQIVSHYLHAIRDPAMPQHAAAKALGFCTFLRIYPYNICFQTNALYLSITDPGVERRRALADPNAGSAFHPERYFAKQLGAVWTFLDEMALVGTLEALDAFVVHLKDVAALDHVPDLPYQNRALPAQRADAAALLEQLEELEQDAALAPFFAIERATYCKAQSLTRVTGSHSLQGGMRAGGRGQGRAGIVAHRSDYGEIILGENFEAVKDPARNGADPRESWWTGERQVSLVQVRLDRPAPRRLIMRADHLHGVSPQEVLLCCGDRWRDVAIATAANGTIAFSAVIDPSVDAVEGYCELSLYLEWNRYPGEAPFYPAIRFTEFELLAGTLEFPPRADQA